MLAVVIMTESMGDTTSIITLNIAPVIRTHRNVKKTLNPQPRKRRKHRRSKMKKYFCIVLLMLVACESKIDKVIPDSLLVGAVPNINVDIKEDHYKGGTAIIATGIIPFDIKREQVKPSLLGVLKTVTKQYPNSTGIFVRLTPDADLGKYAYFAGRTEYEDNEITLYYGVPSDEQIKEWNSEIGKLLPSLFGEKPSIIDVPQLSRFNKETFEAGKKIALFYNKFSKKLHDKYIDQPLKKISSKQIYQMVSREINMPLKNVEYYYRFMNSYFIVGGSWDKETINLNSR